MSDLAWPGGVNPATCSDREWYDVTEGQFCGGCGEGVEMCHPGEPCGDVEPVFPDPMRDRTGRVCDLCPHRVATGQIRAVRRP